MNHGFRLVAALGVLAAVSVTSRPAPATAAGPEMEAVRFDRGHDRGGFHGGGFHGGFRGRGFYRHGYGYGYGYGPRFPGPAGYGLRRRRLWCYYHPGACYPFP